MIEGGPPQHAMRTFACLVSLLFVLLGGVLAADSDDKGGQGTFEKPPADGKPWKHTGTGLSFPQQLGSYRLTAEFRFKEGGGVFIRYESGDDRARGDIFFFPHSKAELSEEATKAVIDNELDSVIANFEKMANEGRYKNVALDELADGEIPLWPKGSLPLTVRSLVATKLADTLEGKKEMQVKLWVGVTMLKGHIITIRYMFPTETGEQGEAASKGFVGTVFQIVKDPQLRAEIKVLADAYLKNPLSPEGDQAAAAVLAYIQKTPFLPVPIPAESLAPWLEHFKKSAPGSELLLLRAFAVASAKSAMNDEPAEASLVSGAKQFLLMYDLFIRQSPLLRLADVEELRSAIDHNDVPAFLKRRAMGGK